MMNVIALAFLLSYFGAVVVLVPEPHLSSQADHHGRYESYTPSSLFGSAKQSVENAVCNQEPCPTSLDQVKDTVQEGYDKTVEGIQSAKESAEETAKGVYRQAKHGVQDKAEQAKQGVQGKASQVKHQAYETAQHAKQGFQDRAGQVKHGAYDTAQQAVQGVQDKAGQVKHGVQEASGKFASHIPSTENVKQSAFETGEKIASHMPSKDGAASSIPGIETGKEVADTLKQKVGETKDRVASCVEDSDTVAYGRDSLDSLRSKLEDAKQKISSFMQGRENDAAYSSFVDMKNTLDEASDIAVLYIPGREGMKKGVQVVQQRVQDASEGAYNAVQGAAHELQGKARDAGKWVHEAAPSYMKPGEGAGSEGHKGKVGGLFHGMKEHFMGERDARDAGGQLERRVHELCSWLDDGVQTPPKDAGHMVTPLDVTAIRESYAYLMNNALGSIEKAREVFERVAKENTAAGERREQYVYLAKSAKGALDAAKDVFERTASAAEGTETAYTSSEKASSFEKASNVRTRLKEAAIHTKQRLSATLRPLVRTIYLSTFSAVYGISLWMTFLSGYVLSCCLPRQQLGIVQSKLFPMYLFLLSSCMGLCTIVHAVLHPWPSADRSERWQYLNFTLCVGLSLLNLVVVEPRATKVIYEKLKYEKEEGRGQSSGDEVKEAEVKAQTSSIDAKLKRLHQTASCLNVAIVAGLTWHLWYLANRLIV